MSAHRPRIAYLTSHSVFSAGVLSGLIRTGAELCGVLRARDAWEPQPDPYEIPVARPESLREMSAEAGIAFERVDRFDVRALETVRAWAPDILLCACWPWKVPADGRALSRLACLNLHTSLLPAYRGPAPLFWQLRDGAIETGVTLHSMTEDLDSGPIVAQGAMSIEPGTSGPVLNRALAEMGVELAISSLDDVRGIKPREQDEATSSYFPWPRVDDFELSAQWSARRAFSFMRGTREYGCLYRLAVGGEVLALESALMFSAHESLGVPLERFGADVRIQFSPGVLHATLARL